MSLPLQPAHLVGTGGAIGALLRVYVSGLVEREDFPIGTLTVNVIGSFVLGLLTFAGVSSETALLVGTGACGSFTTFSSFSFETVRLWETGDRRKAMTYAVGNFAGAVVAIGIAWLVVQTITG